MATLRVRTLIIHPVAAAARMCGRATISAVLETLRLLRNIYQDPLSLFRPDPTGAAARNLNPPSTSPYGGAGRALRGEPPPRPPPPPRSTARPRMLHGGAAPLPSRGEVAERGARARLRAQGVCSPNVDIFVVVFSDNIHAV